MITVRNPFLSDVHLVLKLAKNFPVPEPLNESKFVETWNEKLKDPNSYIGVAETENEIIGYVSGYLHSCFYANGSTFWVDEIFVTESERGKGVGQLLMDSIEDWVKDRDCKLISLATSGADDFYTKIGYQCSARYFKKYLS